MTKPSGERIASFVVQKSINRRKRGEGQDEVIRLNGEHPDWDSTMIAEAMGCSSGYVRAAASRLKMKLPKGWHRNGRAPRNRGEHGHFAPTPRSET